MRLRCVLYSHEGATKFPAGPKGSVNPFEFSFSPNHDDNLSLASATARSNSSTPSTALNRRRYVAGLAFSSKPINVKNTFSRLSVRPEYSKKFWQRREGPKKSRSA